MITDAAPARLADRRSEAVRPTHTAAQATETRRLYAADWAAFVTWCRERRHAALPASPATVAAYLVSLSATLSHGALARRAAAIAGQHRHAGHPAPGRRGSKAGYSWSRVDVAGSGDGILTFSGAVRDGSMCWRSGKAALERP